MFSSFKNSIFNNKTSQKQVRIFSKYPEISTEQASRDNDFMIHIAGISFLYQGITAVWLEKSIGYETNKAPEDFNESDAYKIEYTLKFIKHFNYYKTNIALAIGFIAENAHRNKSLEVLGISLEELLRMGCYAIVEQLYKNAFDSETRPPLEMHNIFITQIDRAIQQYMENRIAQIFIYGAKMLKAITNERADEAIHIFDCYMAETSKVTDINCTN